jgi:hypothetical protein
MFVVSSIVQEETLVEKAQLISYKLYFILFTSALVNDAYEDHGNEYAFVSGCEQ